MTVKGCPSVVVSHYDQMLKEFPLCSDTKIYYPLQNAENLQQIEYKLRKEQF